MSHQLYVSLQNDDAIRRFEFAASNGKLTPRGEYEAKGGPAPMGLSPDGRNVYVGYRSKSPENSSASDGQLRPEYGLGSFAIDPATGDLRPTGRVFTQGEPCYVKTSSSGRILLSSYFQAGHCATHKLDASGAVVGEPVSWIATNSGAHSIQIDPSDRYVFVPHIGQGNTGLTRLPPERGKPANAIFQFKIDPETGKLTPNDPPRVGPGVDKQWGPRHTCWHPTQPWLYVVNEQGNNVSHYTLDRTKGTLTLGKTISNLPPEGFPKKTSTADIQMHKSGKFLYAPNRGHNSIASYAVDQATGDLTHTGWTPAQPRPRAFMLDPTGHYLVSAGFETGNLTSYRIDQQKGTLTELESVHAGNVPMWVLIVEIPGK
jgi:6-phosphogluconolactonase